MKESSMDFPDKLQRFTETLLTWRARRIEKRKRKQRSRSRIADWADAILWAMMVVLLLNQYLLQAYQIPSGSMRNTLIGGIDPITLQRSASDRIFVDKLIYGPELLPGLLKMPGFRESRRSEVIIFENPQYQSRGPGFDILQRVIYMLTFSLVNIDRDSDSGEAAHHFLIKRQAAQDGDRIVFWNGELFIQPPGEERLIPEEEFKAFSGLSYGNQLLLDEGYYKQINAAAKRMAFEEAGLDVPGDAVVDGNETSTTLKKPLHDFYQYNAVFTEHIRRLYPQDEVNTSRFMRYERGLYVPEGWVLPLGDNRNDSQDGRFFGPIPSDAVLGRALFIYWPLSRIGSIH